MNHGTWRNCESVFEFHLSVHEDCSLDKVIISSFCKSNDTSMKELKDLGVNNLLYLWKEQKQTLDYEIEFRW